MFGAELRGEVELGLFDVDGSHGSAHEGGVLDGQVAEASDAEDPDQLGRLDVGDLERLVGRHSCATQRCGVDRADAVRDGDNVGRAGDGVLGERSVDRVATVLLLLAQGFAAVDAVAALAAGRAEPSDGDALADGPVRDACA